MSHGDHSSQFSACAKELYLKPAAPLSASELETMVDSFLSELRGVLQREGCRLIGHIKGVVESGGHESLFFNVTSFGELAHYRNRISCPVVTARMTINVIVAGLEEEAALSAIMRAAGATFGDSLVPTEAGVDPR
jgi:hypothetical protein